MEQLQCHNEIQHAVLVQLYIQSEMYIFRWNDFINL